MVSMTALAHLPASKTAPTQTKGFAPTAAVFDGTGVSTAETAGDSSAAIVSVDPAAAVPSREERIRLAAYAAAEQRGFAPGFDMQDWLATERQIDSEMEAHAPSLRSA